MILLSKLLYHDFTNNMLLKDNKCFSLNRMCLMCSLRQCGITLEFIKVKKIQTRFHGRGKNEASHYCHDCDVSYFYLPYLC